jgi:hypothetical protein
LCQNCTTAGRAGGRADDDDTLPKLLLLCMKEQERCTATMLLRQCLYKILYPSLSLSPSLSLPAAFNGAFPSIPLATAAATITQLVYTRVAAAAAAAAAGWISVSIYLTLYGLQMYCCCCCCCWLLPPSQDCLLNGRRVHAFSAARVDGSFFFRPTIFLSFSILFHTRLLARFPDALLALERKCLFKFVSFFPSTL